MINKSNLSYCLMLYYSTYLNKLRYFFLHKSSSLSIYHSISTHLTKSTIKFLLGSNHCSPFKGSFSQNSFATHNIGFHDTLPFMSQYSFLQIIFIISSQ